jgi:hypothetical protein
MAGRRQERPSGKPALSRLRLTSDSGSRRLQQDLARQESLGPLDPDHPAVIPSRLVEEAVPILTGALPLPAIALQGFDLLRPSRRDVHEDVGSEKVSQIIIDLAHEHPRDPARRGNRDARHHFVIVMHIPLPRAQQSVGAARLDGGAALRRRDGPRISGPVPGGRDSPRCSRGRPPRCSNASCASRMTAASGAVHNQRRGSIAHRRCFDSSSNMILSPSAEKWMSPSMNSRSYQSACASFSAKNAGNKLMNRLQCCWQNSR